MSTAYPPSDGVKTILSSWATTHGYTLQVSNLPDSPDKAVAIMDTPAIGDPNPRWLLDYPSVQCLLRGAPQQYLAAWRAAKALKDVLLGFDSSDVLGDRYVSITMAGDVTFLQYDDSKRPILVMNFNLIIEPALEVGSNRLAL